MLNNLCGDAAMNHLMLCTTMWDLVSEEDGNNRFEELCETGAWKEMIARGAHTAVVFTTGSHSKEDAERIVDDLIANASPVEVTIQKEIFTEKLTVAKTSAGIVLDGHLRQAQFVAERELVELRDRQREESAANAAKMQEAIRAQELAVERLKVQAEEQARQRQAEVEQLKIEQEKARREMKAMRDQMRREGEANAANEKKLRAREKEFAQLKQQANELTGQGKLDAKQLKEERKKAEQARKETERQAKKEAAAEAAKAKEETLAQQREIKEAKQQVETLAAGKLQRAKRWGFF